MSTPSESLGEVTKALSEVEIQDPHNETADVRIINLESHVAEDIYFTDESFKMYAIIFI